MRPRSRALAARAYGAVARAPLPEQPVEVEPGVSFPGFVAEYGSWGPAEAIRFLDRLPQWVDLRGKSVLDVGCGGGALCLEVARRGARQVVGIDTAGEMIRFARAALNREERALPVEFRVSGGDLAEAGAERFDVVLSKDAFEHYGATPDRPSPEAMAVRMLERLQDGGLLLIGFGPLWKAPYGGHLDSWLPWAHLLFPEPVIMERFRRDRRPGKAAETLADGYGVNRMTLRRFRQAMERTGAECLHFETNVGDRRAYDVMRLLARVPALREHFTQNVYGVWRRPDGWRPARAAAA